MIIKKQKIYGYRNETEEKYTNANQELQKLRTIVLVQR